MVAKATYLITKASSVALDGGVQFPSKFSVIAGAFTSGQVFNFGNLAYVTNYYGELRPLHRATPAGSKPPVSPPPPRLLGADLEVLAYQIQHSLGPNPTVLERCQMFYMLANVHH